MSKTKKDHALAFIKAGLHALAPEWGGAIASLVDDYVPTSTEQSITKAVKLLGDKLAALKGRIDVETVNKEDFAELFKSCFLVIIRTQRDEKLRAAAALLANLILRPGDEAKASYAELDHLVRCLDSLSIGAISVLCRARRIAATNRQVHFAALLSAFPQFEPSLLMSLASELRGLNLVRIQEGAIRMPNDEQALLDVTPIGRRFVDNFLSES
jgi:hypothetical protein